MIKHILIIVVTGFLFSCSDTEKLQPVESGSTILAFGDSLTYGTGTSRENSYPSVLEKLTGIEVINAGIPGETSGQGLQRLPGLIERYQPDLIIICQGGNDILRKMDMDIMQGNIQKMIDLARKNNSQAILIGVPDFGIFLEPLPLYRSLAEKNAIPIAEDILSDIISDNRLKADRVHPNAEGYRLLAEEIASLLQRTGALP
jgi:lysophospholipase L1-like esterase